DPRAMPPELLKAHRDNDRAVRKLYGFTARNAPDEASCAAALMLIRGRRTEDREQCGYRTRRARMDCRLLFSDQRTEDGGRRTVWLPGAARPHGLPSSVCPLSSDQGVR
ncbi:MAG: hypothetical protein LBD68_08050, partial [Zoogloeaceae bacterium]|nr:hypothetical protein [Zoogloeaceae bacterium]